MKKRRQEKASSRNAAATVYADAEFPHLTEDQADLKVALERLHDGDGEMSLEEFMEKCGYVVREGKVQERI